MASELYTPPVLLKPFADSGDKNNIPETATGTQQASLDEGFPPVTSLPLTQGGIPPERKDFNGLGNLLSKQYFYLQNGGRFTFNQDVSDAIGGYPQNATLWFKDEALGVSYPVTSLINNNTYNFVTTPSYIDGIKWKRVIDSFPSTQITNCITEIPQDIKLELNNGTLTLKAGSKGYMGDGTVRTITGEPTLKNYGSAKMFLHITSGGTGLYVGYMTGGTVTERPSNPINYASYYNTSTQKCEYYNGSTWSEISLPIAVVTRGATLEEGFTSIDQVFNGFGYIGSRDYVLPNVKYLIPDGRNDDGTLKSILRTTTSVSVNPNNGENNIEVLYYDGSIHPAFSRNYAVSEEQPSFQYGEWYKPSDNRTYIINNYIVTGTSLSVPVASITSIAGKISSLTPKTAFHAVDYNDFEKAMLKEDWVRVSTAPASPDSSKFYYIPEN